VNAFSAKISELKSENESLRLLLEKQKIISDQRFDEIEKLLQKSNELSQYVDHLVMEKSALTKERDDSFVVVENLFARIAEMQGQSEQVDELKHQLLRSDQINQDLQELLRRHKQRDHGGIQNSANNREIERDFSASTSAQTESILTLNKYTQTAFDEIKFRE